MIAIDKLCRVITVHFLGILGVLALLSCPLPVAAQNVIQPFSRLSSLNISWALADFDGDSQPDLVITESPVRNGAYRVSLHLSGTGETSHFDIPWSEHLALTISAQDVDGDRDLDLVITSGIARRPIGVWLNDGTGNFTQGDSSLYPGWIWRGPPALFSRSSTGELPDARPEQSRSTLSGAGSSPFQLAPVDGQRNQPDAHPIRPFLAGQPRVRPPPAV